MSIKQPLTGKTFIFDKKLNVNHYIDQIATTYPHHIAVTCGSHKIEYTVLRAKANQLAHYLIAEKNIKPGDFVGVYFTSSVDLIISILAIIKCGAAYVPLDLTYPEKLIKYILHDSDPNIILTNTNSELFGERALNINEIDVSQFSCCCPSVLFTAETPLYVIYTSGSTGEPKGVMIPHRAAINHMLWMQNEFCFNTTDKILLKTPLTFDPSVWEIFVPLFTGGELVIAPTGSHIDTSLLLHTIIQHEISTIQLVPTILHKFLQHPEVSHCSSLQRVFVGGESLIDKTKQLFFDKLNCLLINLYGPTETTIDVTYYIVKDIPEKIATNYIGMPIYNTEMYIINDDEKLCGIGEEGELYVSGECLGLGYLNKPEISKNSFYTHPLFNKAIYRTGDIVRYNKNGLIEYVCRKDKQIKINGVRVELTAIMAKVMEKKNVANCFILKSSQHDHIYSYLICYIVPQSGKKVDITDIKNSLMSFFPKAVVPKEYFLIDKVPLLPNGKLDANQLKQESEHIRQIKIASFNSKAEVQETLLKMCQRFLHSKTSSVLDDLQENGLDSLSCLILIEQIEKKFHIDLSVHEILSNKTINDLTSLILNKIEHLDSDNDCNQQTVIALKKNGKKTPLFLIHPIGGTVFWYNNLAKYFDEDRPLYGIQDPGIETEGYLFNSIEEMASYYLTHIKNIQPQGPYIIGGASFGATIAIEISRYMKKTEVIAIPVLDGWGVYPNELKDENYFRESMRKQQKDWQEKFNVYGYNEFKKIFATQQHRLELLYQYRMKKIKHRLILFKSKAIMDIFKMIDCYDNHWHQYSGGGLEIINVEGTHETMFHEPHVKELALKLSRALDATTAL